MVATDGNVLVVVFPWGKDEQLAPGTSLHALATGLCQVGKAILLKVDEWEASFEGSAHHRFLARRYGGRHKHGSLCGGREEMVHPLLYLRFCQAARALHLQPDGALKQESVADGRELLTADDKATLHAEEVGVLAFHQQAARVVGEVAEPGVELAFAQEQAVVVAAGKKQAVVAVVLWALSCLFCLLRPGRNRRNLAEHYAAVGFVAARLEALDGLPQVLVHSFFYEEYAVQMVGHHLQGQHFYFWI